MRHVFVCVFAALVAMTGCRADDTETGAGQNARLFAKLSREAAEAGGAALRVKPGQSAKLEVIAYDSPIFGAAVSLPADAVKGAKDPVLVIRPATGFVLEGTADTLSGPPISIELFELGSSDAVKLESAALVSLPFTDTTETDIYNLHIGHLDADAKKWSYLTSERVESKRTRVQGKTLSFSTFAVLQGLQPVEDGAFFFRVLRQGQSVCEGTFRIPYDAMSDGAVSVVNSSDNEVYTKAMYGRDTSFNFVSRIHTKRLLTPESGEVKVSDDFSDTGRVVLQCGVLKVFSEKVANQFVREETFSDWLPSESYDPQPCEIYLGRTCKRSVGVVHVHSRFIFQDDLDATLRAYVTYDLDFSWFVWDKLQ